MRKIIAGILSLIIAFVAIADQGLTQLQRRYLRDRTRLVARDTQTLPGKVINLFRKGGKSWSETNELVRITTSAGRKISKLDLIITLKGINKWSETKAFIRSADLEDEWQACQFLYTSHPAFISATNQAVQAGLATDAEVKRVIEASYDDD